MKKRTIRCLSKIAICLFISASTTVMAFADTDILDATAQEMVSEKNKENLVPIETEISDEVTTNTSDATMDAVDGEMTDTPEELPEEVTDLEQDPENDSEAPEEELELMAMTPYSYTPVRYSLAKSVIGGVPGDAVIAATRSEISVHEGNYGAINGNDNGAVSVGIYQWHATNALRLLKAIVSRNNAYAYSILGDALYNEIITTSENGWTNRIFSNSTQLNALSTLLASSYGQQVQEEQAASDAALYLNYGIAMGLDNAAALVYFADITNQTWIGNATLTGNGSRAVALMAKNIAGDWSKVTLNEMHYAAICFAYTSNNSWVARSASNRNNFIYLRCICYQYVSNLGWNFCNANDALIPTDSATAQADGTIWLQNALNIAQYTNIILDGNYGDSTKNAVIAFQKSQKLTANGVAGRDTIALLIKNIYYTKATTGKGDIPELFLDTKTYPEGTVYRLYNKKSGEHLYTLDANEKNVLGSSTYPDWKYEGSAWVSASSGTPVYRLYNPVLLNHLYTTDANEVKVLTTKYGWLADNGGKPIMYSAGDRPIYRLYAKDLRGMHHLTTDTNEYNNLPKISGYVQEGVAFYALQ